MMACGIAALLGIAFMCPSYCQERSCSEWSFNPSQAADSPELTSPSQAAAGGGDGTRAAAK